MAEWDSRRLDGAYAAVFIDAIVVRVRDGQVANRPIYAAIGVGVAGEEDVLGLGWHRGEGAKFWLSVPHRPQEPRRRRCVLPGLRRRQGPTGGGRDRVAADHGADLHQPPNPEHGPARLPPGPGTE